MVIYFRHAQLHGTWKTFDWNKFQEILSSRKSNTQPNRTHISGALCGFSEEIQTHNCNTYNINEVNIFIFSID